MAEQLDAERLRAAERDERAQRILRVLFTDERTMGERLWSERATHGFELAYSEAAPLATRCRSSAEVRESDRGNGAHSSGGQSSQE